MEQLIKDNLQNIDSILHYRGLPYVLEIIWTELISKHHNNPLAGYFSIKKTYKLIAQKYYWPLFCHNVKDYVKGCNIYLVLKAV